MLLSFESQRNSKVVESAKGCSPRPMSDSKENVTLNELPTNEFSICRLSFALHLLFRVSALLKIFKSLIALLFCCVKLAVSTPELGKNGFSFNSGDQI